MGSKKKNRGGKGVATPPKPSADKSVGIDLKGTPLPIKHIFLDPVDPVDKMTSIVEEKIGEVVDEVLGPGGLVPFLPPVGKPEGGTSEDIKPEAPGPGFEEVVSQLPPDEKIIENIDDREAAEDTLKMIDAEFGDKVKNRYWEIIRDAAIAKAGLPMKPEIKELAVFDNQRAEVFMKQCFPRGKYAEKSILSVEKKEGLAYLERFATKQDYFQRGLSRYIEWRKKHPLKKAKKKRKKK